MLGFADALFEAVVSSACIWSMVGIMLVMQGVSLKNSSVTVLNIYKNVRYKIKK